MNITGIHSTSLAKQAKLTGEKIAPYKKQFPSDGSCNFQFQKAYFGDILHGPKCGEELLLGIVGSSILWLEDNATGLYQASIMFQKKDTSVVSSLEDRKIKPYSKSQLASTTWQNGLAD